MQTGTRIHVPSTVLFLLAAASAADAAVQDPVPLGEAEAASIVDRYIDAANRGSIEDMRALMARGATGFDYVTPANAFTAQDWLSAPFEYPLLQLGLGYPPSLDPGDRLEVNVVERMVVGSMVLQTERWEASRADSTTRAEIHVLYKLRGGRILRMWFLPGQERNVPVGFEPAHRHGAGARVVFDVGHGNAATPDVLYSRMAELLRRDGHVVEVSDAVFDAGSLQGVDVLVIANALPPGHDGQSRPGEEVASAFGEAEIRTLVQWVEQGGSLLLIADHDPMPAASAALAREFAATFLNGAVRDVSRPPGGGDLFSRRDSTLLSHAITDGESIAERVDSVRTFLGQAIEIRTPLEPLLILHDDMRLAQPGDAPDPAGWRPVGGLAQAAARSFGAGRVAIFGEAWLFRFFSTGRIDGNARLILNLFRWLAGG
jgi:hypothetical protein